MILITGGLGFIGSATVQALLDAGDECVLIQRSATSIPEDRFSRPVAVEQGDIRDLDTLAQVGTRHDITGIVHLAGSMPWPPTDGSPVAAARHALGGLFNVLQVAEDWGVQRVSLASTIGVYAGLSDPVLTEDMALAMTAPHLIPTFKKISELLAGHLGGDGGLEIVNLRISGTWGPRGHMPDPFFPAPSLVHAAAMGITPDFSGVRGRLSAEDGLDLNYVADTGRAIALLQLADTLRHSTYNVASGQMTTNAEVLAAIQTVVPGFEVDLPAGSTVPAAHLDITRLREDTGYERRYDTERAVAEYIDWFRAGNAR